MILHVQHYKFSIMNSMAEHFKAGITTMDTADIYGPSEVIVGNFVKTQPAAVPCTKFCCFRYLEEIDKNVVRARILKASIYFFFDTYEARTINYSSCQLTDIFIFVVLRTPRSQQVALGSILLEQLRCQEIH